MFIVQPGVLVSEKGKNTQLALVVLDRSLSAPFDGKSSISGMH